MEAAFIVWLATYSVFFTSSAQMVRAILLANATLHIYPVQLHDRLCQIQSIGCHLHDESPLSFAWVNFHFGTLMPSGSSEDSLKLPAAGPV